MDPTKKDSIKKIIHSLHPDRKKILHLLLSVITEESLLSIANADYGYEADKNFFILKSIKETLIIPPNDTWSYEVLALRRWREPPIDTQTEEIKNKHIERAFCCTILLIAETFPNNYFMDQEGNNQTLIQLIESSNYLGSSFQQSLVSFLAWKIDLFSTFDDDHIYDPFFLLGLIYQLLKTSYPISDSNLKELVLFLVNTVNSFDLFKISNETDHWLLNTTYFTQRHYKWIQLGKELPSLLLKIKDESLIKQLNHIGKLLVANESFYLNKN